jgi:acyl dehydratase
MLRRNLAKLIKTNTDSNIIIFSATSGDINPDHLNHACTRETIFEGGITRGMLMASLVSTAIGTK